MKPVVYEAATPDGERRARNGKILDRGHRIHRRAGSARRGLCADDTRVMREMFAPDRPVPRLPQGLIKSCVQSEGAKAASNHPKNVPQALSRARA